MVMSTFVVNVNIITMTASNTICHI